MGYSPWGSRRVEHNLATEQQQQLWSVSSLSLEKETYIRSIIIEVGIKEGKDAMMMRIYFRCILFSSALLNLAFLRKLRSESGVRVCVLGI